MFRVDDFAEHAWAIGLCLLSPLRSRVHDVHGKVPELLGFETC
jgi:hypothetical protein